MKRIVFLFMVVIQLYSMPILAQTGVFELLNRDQYMAKVKLVDEFFARFNGEETRKYLGPEYADRESGVLLLFDIAKFKSKADSNFIAAKTFEIMGAYEIRGALFHCFYIKCFRNMVCGISHKWVAVGGCINAILVHFFCSI